VDILEEIVSSQNMTTNTVKLADMGTTGLVQFVIAGNIRLRGARMGKAKAIIANRTQRWESVNAFVKCVNYALGYREVKAK
jgi:hypothetical protein